MTISRLILTAVVALAAVTPALAQCPDAVNVNNPPTPAPTNGSLSWSIANGVAADYFIVYFGPQGSGCTTSVLTTSRGGSSFSVDYIDLAPNTTYEWRVEAVKNGCSTIASSCSTFRTGCSTTGPTLISPPDGATDDHLKTTFAWDSVFGAASYDVFVQINGALPATRVGSTTGTDFTADIPPGTHTWYVEAVFRGGCPPARSATQTFGTSCPTTNTTLISPAAGEALSSPRDIRFEWTAVSGADGYDVYASRNGAPATKIGAREGVALASTSITVTLAGPGSYVWFVDVLSSGCSTRRSGNGGFTIADNCPTTPPSATAPANNATVTGDVQFNWSAVPNATSYNVWIALNGGDATLIGNTTATTFTTKLPTGTHSWFVEAVLTDCPALRSGSNTFTVATQSQCPTIGPALQGPPANMIGVGSPVNFSWAPMAGAHSYIVFAGVDGATPENVAQVTTTSTSVLIAPGTVTWYVEAEIEGCGNVRSETRTFTINLPPACQTVGAELVQPFDNTTIVHGADDSPIELVWKAVRDARDYTVTIIRNGSATVISGVDKPVLSNHPSLESAGTIQWFVTANFEGACANVESARRTFTLVDKPPCVVVPPLLVSPNPSQVLISQIVTFRWTPLLDVTSYQVFARLDANQPPAFLGSIPAGGPNELEVTLPYGANEWYMEVIGPRGCGSARSNPVPFEVRRAIICSTRPVTLQSPPPNVSLSNPVQLLWNGVSGATGYQAFIVGAGGSPTEVTEITTELSTTINPPSGEYEWYVIAYFPGCDPTTSERQRFIVSDCELRPPQITSPLDPSRPVTSPVSLGWTPVRNATSYDVFVGTDGEVPSPIASVNVTTGGGDQTHLSINLPTGPVSWYIRAQVPGCPPSYSAPGDFTVTGPPPCTAPTPPIIAVQPEVSSTQPYPVVWPQVPNATSYEIDEARTPDFDGAITQIITGTEEVFSHGAAVDTTFYYRVRARSTCGAGAFSPYSNIASITVRAPEAADTSRITSVGSQQTVVQSLFVPGAPGITLRFAARTDKPWLHVSPASGNLPPAGVTLTVTADTAELQAGGNTGSVIVDISAGSKAQVGTAPSTTIPVSVSLVSPVLPSGKGSPGADSLIIPAVASAAGANNAFFQSDVRVANVSGEGARYLLLFTPSGAEASRVGQQANVDIQAGQTVALDNLLRTWFGASTQNVTGVLEVRPLKTGAQASQVNRSRSTIGSSRTFNSTANGTLGQFIPAIPFAKFAGRGQTLALIQVAESANYRTNLGLVEGSGNPASVRVTAYDGNGARLMSADYDLKAGEHRQINSLLRTNGITTDNARFEIEVTSGTGRVTAYTSTIDNRTNDPLLVSATDLATLGDTNLVLPGIADIDTGGARWRSDVRLYNAGASAVNASLFYYPSDNSGNPKQMQVTIAPGETRQIDDILRSQFGIIGSGGAVHVRTSSSTKLIASARTYTDTGSGTYGQFIPAVSLKNSAGRESGAIHALQLEESSAFRSNVGIAEVNGKAATVEITVVIPDSKVAPRIIFELQPNQFRQFNSLLGQMGLGATYNARVAVRVIEGDGRIASYVSAIDNKTNDPTYVPAEQ